MKEYLFETELFIPRARGDVFQFFADAHNLPAITPPWLRFQVLTPAPIDMRAGALIEYRLKVHHFPIRWLTEIIQWLPPEAFVDVQRRGPYRLWHHTHQFEERTGGTLCKDSARYWPIGGALANRLLVRRDIEGIFRYRRQRLLDILGGNAKPLAHARG